MSVPVIIGPAPPANPTTLVCSESDNTQIAGPFLASNGKWYQLVNVYDTNTGNVDIGLCESQDGGITYPTITTIAGITTRADFFTAISAQVGDTLAILYTVTTGPSQFDFYTVVCNLATQSFGTPNHTPLSHITASSSPVDFLIAVNGAGEQVVCYDIQNNTGTAASVFAIRFTSGAWSAAILLSNVITLAYLDEVLVDGNGDVRVLWSDWQGFGPSPSSVRNAMYETRLSGGVVAATYTAFANANDVNNKGYADQGPKPGVYNSTNDQLLWPICKQTLSGPIITSFEVGVLICSNASTAPTYSYQTAWSSAASPNYVIGWPSIAVKSDGSEVSLIWPEDARPVPFLPNGLTLRRVTASTATGPWSTLTTFYDPAVDPPAQPIGWTGSVMFFTWSRYVGAPNAFAANVDFAVTGSGGFVPFNFAPSSPAPPSPPVLVTSAGGRGFVKVVVNHFDSCLGREYLLYKLINRELLKCGVKPFCFCFNERDWGGNFSEHEEVPMGPPEGAIAFNPTGQLVLPTAASGDNVIFQTRVPIGYDGVILGQYHGYIPDPTAMPVPFFVQGGGDIVWRLEAAGRCVRDCGIMEVSIGSLQNMAPVAGGLQVRSGNLIQYIVAVPNTSGSLTAGVGNIVAGLHGYYWPRK